MIFPTTPATPLYMMRTSAGFFVSGLKTGRHVKKNNMTEKYYAHSLEGKAPSDWQPLDGHLKNVAEMARSFAEFFGAGEWGYLAGLFSQTS